MSVIRFNKINRALLIAGLSASTFLLSACGEDQNISLDPVEQTAEQQAATNASVIMDFANGDIPFPHDALFSGSVDGTLNIPVNDENDYSDPRVAMNTVDGFSTSAPITFKVSKSLDLTDGNFNGLPDILEVGLAIYETDAALDTKAVSAVGDQLIPGVDYLPVVSDADGVAKNIAIIPLKPLKPSKTYLITVNTQMEDNDDRPLAKSLIYAALSSTDSLEGTSLEELTPLQHLTLAHLQALAEKGVDTSAVVASWSFSTQSIGVTLQNLYANVSNNSLAVGDTNFDTTTFGGDGSAEIYAGTLSVPYYGGVPTQENPLAPVNTFWHGVSGSMLSQFNVAPEKQSPDQTIPVLMSVPTDDAAKPDDGWPMVIFQHGITQNRGNLLAVADSLAKAGFAAIAIDMPLHGISADSSLAGLRISGVSERTFDVDYDGVEGADPSGQYFINLRNLPVTRDNLRQAVSDLMNLKASLTNIAGIDANLLDESQVSFAGHSLGAMVGGIYQSFDGANTPAAVYAMPGQQMVYFLAASPNFRSEIIGGLAASGIEESSSEFNQFLLAAQTVIETGDPLNYATSITNPTLLFEVVGDGTEDHPSDKTIPNSVATAPLAGTDPLIVLMGLNSVSPENDTLTLVADKKGVMRFTAGDHSSLLSPNANLTVTVEMQEAMASFLASGGAAVQISDNEKVQ